MLSKYVDNDQKTWDETLLFVVFATNTSKHDVTGFSPFEMIFGRTPTLPMDITLPTISEPFNVNIRERLQDVHAVAAARIEAQHNYIYGRDEAREVTFMEGDAVLVFNPSGKKGKATKLLSRWYGPYMIVKQTSPVNYEIATQGKRRKQKFVVHVSRIKPFRDRNELYEDSSDEEGEGWIPTAKVKKPSSQLPDEEDLDWAEELGRQLVEVGREETPPASQPEVPSGGMGTVQHAKPPSAVVQPKAAAQPATVTPQVGVQPTAVETGNSSDTDNQPRRSRRSTKGKRPDRLIETKCAVSTGQPVLSQRQPLLWMAFKVLAMLTSVNAVKIEVCDCSKPQFAGVVDFRELMKCPTSSERITGTPVQFDLYMEQDVIKSFKGYVCRTWEETLTIDETFIFTTDTKQRTRHVATCPQSCWMMVQTRKCGDQTLQKVGNVLAYRAEPVGQGSWNSQKNFTTLNCELEEITLEQECDRCTVMSVTGEISNSRTEGYSIQGLRTYIWSDVGVGSKPCEVARFNRRNGTLFADKDFLRVRDREHQLDFILGGMEAVCDAALPRMYTVVGEAGLHVILLDERGSALKQSPTARIVLLTTPKPRPTTRRSARRSAARNRTGRSATASGLVRVNGTAEPALTLQQAIPAHLQYITDITLAQENELADAVNALHCRLNQNRVADLFTLSIVLGILAARSVEMNHCQSLQVFGSAGIIRQCRTVELDFVVDDSGSCGPQPRTQNWSIAQDGFLLVPYRDCLWQTSIVNFRGMPFESRNGEWIRVKPSKKMERQLLAHHFKQQVDVFGGLLQSAMDREHSMVFHLLGQLAGTMEEQGVGDVGTLVESVSKTAQIPDIINRVAWLKGLPAALYSP